MKSEYPVGVKVVLNLTRRMSPLPILAPLTSLSGNKLRQGEVIVHLAVAQRTGDSSTLLICWDTGNF